MSPKATTDDLINEILAFYSGYSWDGKTKLLNPFSIIKLLGAKDFSNFWFETGSPSFLMNLVKNNRAYFNLFQKDQAITADMNALDIGKFSIKSLMFQTGYLTVNYIKRIHKTKNYFLTFPNHEVRSSFFAYLLADITSFDNYQELWMKGEELREALIQEDPAKASLAFSILLGTIPWPTRFQAEDYYRTIFFMALGLIGQPLQVQIPSGDGLIDAVLDAPGGHILVIEMKWVKLPGSSDKVTGAVLDPKPTEDELAKINKLLDDGAIQAFEQINSWKYTDKDQLIGRKITKIAMVVCQRTYARVIFNNI
ncbi:MAG: PD-(D/E)XK nuclease domain-containing protein [Deltaproteobacteria bacterium]|nr:PD-(D/E)XK nuclease domain-containing protein [Deltaproteobacteria bacterium]